MGQSTPVLSDLEKVKLRVHGRVKMAHLIESRMIRTPARLETVYRGIQLNAVINEDGTISFNGENFSTPSGAAVMAKKCAMKSSAGKSLIHTDGWVFWKYKNPETGRILPLSRLRARYLLSINRKGSTIAVTRSA